LKRVVPRRIAAPRRLRRRLTVAFVLVAAVSAGALAGGSYVLVRQARLADSAARAVEQTELHVEGLRTRLPRRATAAAVRAIVASFGTASSTVAIVGGVTVPTISLGEANVPRELIVDVVRQGYVGYQRTVVGGTPYVVAGSKVPAHNVEIYSFFNEQALGRDMAKLGLILLSGWAVVVLLAAGVGFVLARRTLAPVAAASEAARSMAEGLLETRLPVEGDDEFGAWAASFNEMAQALETKIADLSEARDRERRFTSDVSHELRTPLTALVSEASMLREHLDEMPLDARRPAELLVADVGRLRRMVEDLMEISRFDAGREVVRIEPVEVGAVVRQILRARGWESRVEVSGGDVVIETDRRRLERIVGNLVGNALEHGGGEVPATVRVARDGVRALVEVADRGPGIAPEHLPHLFDRFYKADPSRSSPGSGLGLGIAMENARLLGGDIHVRSRVGSGSTFTVVLPVTEPLPGGEPGVSSGIDDGRTSIRREL
jgi:two-component system, OmpR family, sensor histidine kinase MtrB